MEVYESHLGGIYFSKEILPWECIYCEQCGDSDWHLGHADTFAEAIALVTDEDGLCRYEADYLYQLKSDWEKESE